MSVAAAKEWYYAERRVMSMRQQRSGRVQRNRLKIEGNVGTAFDLSFLSLLIFSDLIEIRLGSVSVFDIKQIYFL